jgi:hypothetical protein
MSMKYRLDEKGNPIAEPDLIKWAQWFEKSERSVAQEQIGESGISTVFLGLDHSFSECGSPILWETMVFGGKLDQEQDRCGGSREQAEAMHARMVERVRKANHD